MTFVIVKFEEGKILIIREPEILSGSGGSITGQPAKSGQISAESAIA
jgi:hypothetical protein